MRKSFNLKLVTFPDTHALCFRRPRSSHEGDRPRRRGDGAHRRVSHVQNWQGRRRLLSVGEIHHGERRRSKMTHLETAFVTLHHPIIEMTVLHLFSHPISCLCSDLILRYNKPYKNKLQVLLVYFIVSMDYSRGSLSPWCHVMLCRSIKHYQSNRSSK